MTRTTTTALLAAAILALSSCTGNGAGEGPGNDQAVPEVDPAGLISVHPTFAQPTEVLDSFYAGFDAAIANTEAPLDFLTEHATPEFAQALSSTIIEPNRVIGGTYTGARQRTDHLTVSMTDTLAHVDFCSSTEGRRASATSGAAHEVKDLGPNPLTSAPASAILTRSSVDEPWKITAITFAATTCDERFATERARTLSLEPIAGTYPDTALTQNPAQRVQEFMNAEYIAGAEGWADTAFVDRYMSPTLAAHQRERLDMNARMDGLLGGPRYAGQWLTQNMSATHATVSVCQLSQYTLTTPDGEPIEFTDAPERYRYFDMERTGPETPWMIVATGDYDEASACTEFFTNARANSAAASDNGA